MVRFVALREDSGFDLSRYDMGPVQTTVKQLTEQTRVFRNHGYLGVFAGDLDDYLAYCEVSGFFPD